MISRTVFSLWRNRFRMFLFPLPISANILLQGIDSSIAIQQIRMISSKEIERITKRRSKSQRLKKSFEVFGVRSDPKSDRKNSSVKESFSHANIKGKKEKPKHQAETIKIKGKNPKVKGKEQVSANSLVGDHQNSVTHDIGSTVAYRDQLEKRDERIREQEDTISELKEELKFLNYKLKRIEERNQAEEEIVEERESKKVRSGKREVEKEKGMVEERIEEGYESLGRKIENLESQVLAQSLMKQELMTYIKELKKMHKRGITEVVTEIKKILVNKVKAALASSYERIKETDNEYQSKNTEEFERKLKDLPGAIHKEFEKQLGL